MKKTICALLALCGFVASSAFAEDYTLINGKEIKDAVILLKTNNLIRMLHTIGTNVNDNTYQFEYFTRPSQKKILKAKVDVAKRKELERIIEEKQLHKKARLEIKNDVSREPAFPVTWSDLKYMGGGIAQMTMTSVSSKKVRVMIISGRVIQQQVILNPGQTKERVMFRHRDRDEAYIRIANEEKILQKTLNVPTARR